MTFCRAKKIVLMCAVIMAALGATSHASAQRRASVGFYNVENLFDTLPSAYYDDTDYTPAGKMAWDSRRYQNKLANIARVIDDLSLDVIGLCEIENEATVRDLVSRLKTDYNYIFRESGDSGGRELALLYKADRFVPTDVRLVRSGSTRWFLYVPGELCGHRVDVVVCHLPSLMNRKAVRARAMKVLYSFVERVRGDGEHTRLLVMGDFNASPGDALLAECFYPPGDCDNPLFCPLEEHARSGRGSYASGNKWKMFDNVYLCPRLREGSLRYRESGVFIRDYLLHDGTSKRKGYPLRTYSGATYLNGFSDHLPVFVVFDAD